MDLVDFLRARLAEDEQTARGHEQWSASWHQDDLVNEIRDDENAGTVAHVFRLGDRTHIARHDPARVLAEVTWRRIIVGNYAALLKTFGGVDWAKGKNDPVMSGTLAAMETLHSVLRAMATVYAEHPDYREEWKP